MYARTVEHNNQEQVLTFGVSGKLIMNVLVMYDRQTATYWSQLLGKAIEGELAGATLEPLPALQTTWGEWKALHPNTKALVTNGAGRYDTYESYYSSGQTGVIGESRKDSRLQVKELIAGAVVEGQPVAYPHSQLAKETVVNDQVGETPLLVVFKPDTATSLIFDRRINDQILTFTQGQDALEMVDQETGSTWFLLTGKAISGPLEGELLARVPSTASFWFGWKDWYPETLIYGES